MHPKQVVRQWLKLDEETAAATAHLIPAWGLAMRKDVYFDGETRAIG
jgi:hypothetical protein